MMPPLHWVRAAAWKLYHTCASIKQVGDQALRMGNYDLALAKYQDSQNVFKRAQADNENISGVEDPDRATELSQLEKSKFHHYRGITYAIRDNHKAALTQFRKAAQCDRMRDQRIELDLAITKRHQAAESPKEKTAAGKVKASRLKDEPLEHENPIFTTSKFIDGERYLLRKLGYHGDMLEHIHGTKGVDMKEMDKVVKSLEISSLL
ncbi:hypothetical protein HO173_007132 [Letharia columbiana]|uniref:Uncharacterized protein n=1 Tax=Letharia columbiana TaxID=112416 RepID=A0A8H6L3T7_9LECA|nr:uncharacterized protein HO173_007132 [Letharia columbiana]KAF6234507.1 hypothetical protein HO173_007132 [Letharia columbiana]